MRVSPIENYVKSQLNAETSKRKKIPRRILDVILFFWGRGLAFCGTAERIGNIHNGNFLGFIDFFRKFDAILADHVERVRKAQEDNIRLSCESQN